MIPFAALPIGTDRSGLQTPWAARVIVVLAALMSGAYLYSFHTNSSLLPQWKELALWTGSVEPDAATLVEMYSADRLGDRLAFETLLEYLINEVLDEQARRGEHFVWGRFSKPYEDLLSFFTTDELVLDAHRKLGPNQRCTTGFEPHQLLTSAFLHDSAIRLFLSLLFFYVFASHINAAIGHAATAALFLLIALAAGLAQVWLSAGAPLAPVYGLSGAVMGMAGASAVLLPECRVHVIICYRSFAKASLFELNYFVGRWSPWTIIALYAGLDLLLAGLLSRRGASPHGLLGGLAAGLMLGFLMRRLNLVERLRHGILGRLPGPAD